MFCPQVPAGIKAVPLPVLPVFGFPLPQALGGFAVQPGRAAREHPLSSSLPHVGGLWDLVILGCRGPGAPRWCKEAGVEEGGVKIWRISIAAKLEKSCSALCTEG